MIDGSHDPAPLPGEPSQPSAAEGGRLGQSSTPRLAGLDGSAPPDGDCVLSSRVRLARNMVGFAFVNRATPDELHEVVHRVQAARLGGPYEEGTRWVNVQATSAEERLLLFERNLISRPFVESPHPRCVAISRDETTSVMVNEEDHLRLQMLAPGLQLRPLAERMFTLDQSLERSLEFAFHPRFGYLTACPTNVGTGIRLGAMLHLPALRILDELPKVQRAAKDMHLAVRGFHGEGTEAIGDFYQVSNQNTLGRSEQDLVDEFTETVVPRFVAYERAARRTLLERDAPALDDRVHRALGVLRNCRLLSRDEAIKLLSRVRLGVSMERIAGIPMALVNRLLLEVQPAHLSRSTGAPLRDADDRAMRAELVRGTLR
ncbi:MAG: hypothetical protein RIS86_1429 [Planctomycetota bacterium]